MWNSPGFSKLTSNYTDLTVNRAANAQWCEFIAEKIRSIVKDPETAERLIPKDHLYAEKRPPFVTGYYEAYNRPNVSLVDLKQTPIVRVTESGIETTEGVQEFDIIVWATGFDFGTGALARLGIRGRRRSGARATTGRTARRPSSASRPPASPTSSSPAGRTPPPATTRGTTVTRSTSSPRPSSICATTATTPSKWTRAPRSGGRPWSTPARRCRPSGRAATTSAPTSPGSPASTS